MALALLPLVVLAGAGWQIMRINLANNEAADGDFVNQLKTPKRVPPRYFALESMVVNLADPGGNRFVQLSITLELGDAKTENVLRQMMPAIRSRLLLLVSQRSADDLLGNEGKKALADDIRSEVSNILQLSTSGNSSSIERVLFNSLIVQ